MPFALHETGSSFFPLMSVIRTPTRRVLVGVPTMIHVIIESRSVIIRSVVDLAPNNIRLTADAICQAAVAVLMSIRRGIAITPSLPGAEDWLSHAGQVWSPAVGGKALHATHSSKSMARSWVSKVPLPWVWLVAITPMSST